MEEYYYNYNVAIGTIVNLEHIDQVVQSQIGSRMLMVESSMALQPNFFSYLKQFGLRDKLMLFLQNAGDTTNRIHTDYASEDTRFHHSFNVICSGQGTMTWFRRPNDGGFIYRHPNNPKHILYEIYPEAQLEALDHWTAGKVALVRTCVPHGVTNNYPEDRVCLSIRTDDHGWEEDKKILDTYFKINDLYT